MTDAWINRIGTAVPPHDMHKAFVAVGLASLREERPRALFERMAAMSGISHRHAVFAPGVSPHSEYLDAEGFYRRGAFPSTARRMERYKEAALELALRAVEALDLGEQQSHITHLIVASCTGFHAPGIDFGLMQRLALSGSIERTMIGFMGCFAAITALRNARHIVRADPTARVLVVCVELCSLHLQDSNELTGLLSYLLFSDGAAAALVSSEPSGVILHRFHTEVLPDTEGLITWDIGDSGFLMQLSGKVPGEIRRYLARDGRTFLERLGERNPPTLWAVHAGGRTILDAVQDGFGLPPPALIPSRFVLRDFGNISSATLLFVLDRLMRDDEARGPGIAMAFGPGLTVESFAFHRPD